MYESVLARMADARYPPGEAKQAFLNLYFGADIVHLPYVYNANLVINNRTPMLWDTMRNEMCIVHYTSPKPFPKDGKEIVDGTHLECLVEKVR
jgi:glycogenin glucosyltransferase